LVAWAALLHDITHIPIGHTLEDEYDGLYTKHDALNSPRHIYLWGYEGQRSNIRDVLINIKDSLFPPYFPENFLSDRKKLIDLIHLIVLYREGEKGFEAELDKARRKASELLEPNHEKIITHIEYLEAFWNQYKGILFHPFMTDLISNTICADLLDYLKRDAYYTGLDISYDPRILKSFIVKPENGFIRVALKIRDNKGVKRIDIVSDVINLVKMRHDIALKVYYHKTKSSASAMLVRAMQLLDNRPKDISQEEPDSVLDYQMGNARLLSWLRDKAATNHQKQESMELVEALGKKNFTKLWLVFLMPIGNKKIHQKTH
jgi:HD superfamily phosphohydrolase